MGAWHLVAALEPACASDSTTAAVEAVLVVAGPACGSIGTCARPAGGGCGWSWGCGWACGCGWATLGRVLGGLWPPPALGLAPAAAAALPPWTQATPTSALAVRLHRLLHAPVPASEEAVVVREDPVVLAGVAPLEAGSLLRPRSFFLVLARARDGRWPEVCLFARAPLLCDEDRFPPLERRPEPCRRRRWQALELPRTASDDVARLTALLLPRRRLTDRLEDPPRERPPPPPFLRAEDLDLDEERLLLRAAKRSRGTPPAVACPFAEVPLLERPLFTEEWLERGEAALEVLRTETSRWPRVTSSAIRVSSSGTGCPQLPNSSASCWATVGSLRQYSKKASTCGFFSRLVRVALSTRCTYSSIAQSSKTTTCETSAAIVGTSTPRPITSVTTSARNWPFRNWWRAHKRPSWDLPPCMAATLKPRSQSCAARPSATRFSRTKTRALLLSTSPRTFFRWSVSNCSFSTACCA